MHHDAADTNFRRHYGAMENNYRVCVHCQQRVHRNKLIMHQKMLHGITIKPILHHLTDRQYQFVERFTNASDSVHYLNPQRCAISAGYKKPGQERVEMQKPSVREAILEALQQKGVDDSKVAEVMQALLNDGEESTKARMIETYFKVKGAYAPQEVNHAMQTTEVDRMRKRHEYLQSLQLNAPVAADE